jgi:hypothetical protein
MVLWLCKILNNPNLRISYENTGIVSQFLIKGRRMPPPRQKKSILGFVFYKKIKILRNNLCLHKKYNQKLN